MAEKKKKTVIKKPGAVAYTLLYLLVAVFLRLKCNIHYDKSGLKDLKGPALVLCPHTSNMDFLFVATTLMPQRPTFVVSEHFMAKPFIRRFLTSMRVISKKMFCPDIKTIMNIIRAKDNGNVIVLFPEGRLPCAGHSLPVTEGTADLVKKLGVNVYTVTGNGAYKTLPKWGQSGFRKGRMEVTTSKLLDGSEIKDMTIEQINAVIEAAILHDEDNLFENIKYKCKKPALGLDGVLYKCPECKEEFKMSSNNHSIRCQCGFVSELDNYYRLHGGPFEKINDWYFWQESLLDLDEPLESETIVATPDGSGNMDRNAGRGTIRLDRESISFSGSCFGQPLEFSEPTSVIKALPISVGDHFDLYHRKKLYNFILQPDPRQVVKWSLYMDKLSKENSRL